MDTGLWMDFRLPAADIFARKYTYAERRPSTGSRRLSSPLLVGDSHEKEQTASKYSLPKGNQNHETRFVRSLFQAAKTKKEEGVTETNTEKRWKIREKFTGSIQPLHHPIAKPQCHQISNNGSIQKESISFSSLNHFITS